MRKLIALSFSVVFLLSFLAVLPIVNSQQIYSVISLESNYTSKNSVDWSFKVLDGGLEKHAYPVSTSKGYELRYILNSFEESEKYSGLISFPVSYEGLTAYKQLPLNEELNLKDYDFVNATHAIRGKDTIVFRPENVVNSYALFNNSGFKVLHIYASKLIDSKGNICFVDMNLNKDFINVELNKEWLENAVFPVIVDPTFGYSSHGASDASTGGAGKIACRNELVEDATITKLTVYTVGAPSNMKACIFADNGGSIGSLVASTGEYEVGSLGEYDFDLSSPYSASTSYYWLMFTWSTVSMCIRYDSGGGVGFWDFNYDFNVPTNSWSNRVSIWATYTVEGGEGGEENISVSLSSPINESILSYGNINFNFTPSIIGTDVLVNASLYVNSSFISLNTSILVNVTQSTIYHSFGDFNASYTWFIRLYNSTAYSDSETLSFSVQIIISDSGDLTEIQGQIDLLWVLGITVLFGVIFVIVYVDRRKKK